MFLFYALKEKMLLVRDILFNLPVIFMIYLCVIWKTMFCAGHFLLIVSVIVMFLVKNPEIA